MANKTDKLLLCQKNNNNNQTATQSIPDGHRQMVHIPLDANFSLGMFEEHQIIIKYIILHHCSCVCACIFPFSFHSTEITIKRWQE